MHVSQVTCELRDYGQRYGWEAQILCDGELVIGRRFLSREHAVAWAAKERTDLEAGRSTLSLG
jgi:hypothetical protein